MVVVTIELWPFGKEKGKRLLGIMRIANDCTGDKKHGNYDVALSHSGKYINREGIWKRGRVENHKRSLSPYHLVCKALGACLGL